MKRLDRLYMGTNTKMYKTISDTTAFLSRLDQLTADIPADHLELFVIPSYTSLESASRTVAGGSGSEPKTWAGRMKASSPGRFPPSCCRKSE